MTNETQANLGFEKQLWDAACVLWGHIPAAEYRKVIIGLIFLRYISAAFALGELFRSTGDRERALIVYQEAAKSGYVPAQTRIDQMNNGEI